MSEKLISLWNSILAGNGQDYTELHSSLYPRLFVFACKMLNDGETADDLLQDLFMKFWENRLKIGSLENVEAYFYRSARSIVLNHIRLTKYRKYRLRTMPDPGFVFSAEDIIVSKESDSMRKRQMILALNSLPAKQREIITMRFYKELSNPQIADILNIRYQSVSNHVCRAVHALRRVSDLSEICTA
jgi:RNA polymerase sigma factor (sigma-70 family)